MSEKRLIKELNTLQKSPSPALVSCGPRDQDLYTWEALLKGPVDSPYEGGVWKVRIDIPKNYPHAPPTMNFETKICHPNIHLETGEVCIDVLKDQWTPAWGIASALMAVQTMLGMPEPDSPLNIDAASLVRLGDMKAYNQLIQYYRHLYNP